MIIGESIRLVGLNDREGFWRFVQKLQNDRSSMKMAQRLQKFQNKGSAPPPPFHWIGHFLDASMSTLICFYFDDFEFCFESFHNFDFCFESLSKFLFIDIVG